MPVGDIVEMGNISILDFNFEQGVLIATVYERGTLDVRRLEIGTDEYFLDDIDLDHNLNGRPIIGYVVEDEGRPPHFYSINYEHGEML